MMQIIEIVALPNGAHRNQTWYKEIIPDGWALIPENMAIPATFPFVDIKVKDNTYLQDDEQYTRKEVVEMTAGVMPEPEPEPEKQPTAQEDTDAMMVDHEYRLTMLELGLFE